MNQERINQLIASKLSGEIKPEELTELQAWREMNEENAQLYTDSLKIWEKAERNEAEPDIELAWKKLSGQLLQEQPVKLSITRNNNKQVWMRIAAAVMLVAFAGFLALRFLNAAMVEVKTAAGEQKHLVLPDGSEIWLNENTTFSYPEKFADNSRKVKLSGEAFFDIQRDEQKPFSIESDHALTTVLGTSFSVKDNALTEQAQLIVKTGKVSFRSKASDRELIVKAGESAHLEMNGDVAYDQVYHINGLAWKDKKLVFNDLTIREIVPVFEKYFGLTLQVEDQQLLNCHFTGEFENPQSEEVLNILCRTLQVEWSKSSDKTITIKGKGCLQ